MEIENHQWEGGDLDLKSYQKVDLNIPFTFDLQPPHSDYTFYTINKIF